MTPATAAPGAGLGSGRVDPARPQTCFISDLHLCDERPHINQVFFDFTTRVAPAAEALYILGDLFEYWVGDDDRGNALAEQVALALAALADGGTRVYLMQGNRDVLMRTGYARRCHATLLPDPTLIDLYGTPTLLMHGDTLCTDDVDYQKFRACIRKPLTQALLLALPLAMRHAKARAMRAKSEAAKSAKNEAIMDVAATAVEEALRTHSAQRLIHGHTHRPAAHRLTFDGRSCERHVLAAWYTGGSYLRCDASGCVAKAV